MYANISSLFTRTFTIIAVLAILTGCATKYQEEGFFGGYSEINVSPDTFIVTFKGNEYSSAEQIYAYTLRRASELTLLHGHKYFSIVATNDRTENSSYVNTKNQSQSSHDPYETKAKNSSSSSTYATTIKKPIYTITIKCHDQKTHDDVIDASYFLINNPS